jgi:transcriptional regulator NrdR family protein
MKCPHCKAWVEVLETRMRADGVKRRRYTCANMHRFTTLEAVVEDRKMREKNDDYR